MKYGVVMASELGNRWDAGFHLLNQQYKEVAATLEKNLGGGAKAKTAALEVLHDELAFPVSALKEIQPLCRGGNPSYYRMETYRKAMDEYPFLCLAILMDTAPDKLKQRRDELETSISKLDAASAKLSQLTVSLNEEPVSTDMDVNAQPECHGWGGLVPIPDDLLPLLKTHRYVTGVVYKDGDELIIPVHTEDKTWVSDCWVIEVTDWTGPSMLDTLVAEGNVPVPRQYQDMGTPIGYVELPDHTVNYSMGWLRWS